MATVLACGPGALVSHRSAARVFVVLPYPAIGDVWITTTSEGGRGLKGVRVTRTRNLEPDEVAFIGWLPVTSPARTLLDLAGVVDEVRLEQAVAEAQVRRLVIEADLRRQLARSNGRRGAAALRSLLGRGAEPALTRSEAERRLLSLIRGGFLPEPETNVRVGTYLVDFLWPKRRVIVEFDGFAFHSERRAFKRDRDRTNELQLHGYVVIRLTWEHLTRERSDTIDRLRRALGLSSSAR